MSDLPFLSISILLPLLSALYITFFVNRGSSDRKELYAMYVAILASVLTLITTIYLWIRFDPEVNGYQFIEKYSWIESIGLYFHLGIDGFSFSTGLTTNSTNIQPVKMRNR